MEPASGVQGFKELKQQGTPVDIIEGDGDSSLMARLRTELKAKVQKKFDRNHVIKNIGKKLYELQKTKTKISKAVIMHLQKCVRYIIAKNQGEADNLTSNMKALIPHQFGDHSLCEPRWCGYKRSDRSYKHKSLPYNLPLKDLALKEKLGEIFEPIIARSASYADLGSSQQCEHANKEVTLRADKGHHYGESESLDYRVKATSAFVNMGRAYLAKVTM